MTHFAEADLTRLAQSAVLEHGEDAPSFAHLRAAERLRSLDLDGARNWCKVGLRTRLILSRMTRALH